MRTTWIFSLIFLVASAVIAAPRPNYCTATHDVGRMHLVVTNAGMLGTGYRMTWASDYTPFLIGGSDCHLGGIYADDDSLGGEYPHGSGAHWLRNGGLWVGGVNAWGDTLVSTSYFVHDWWASTSPMNEFSPDIAPRGGIDERLNQSEGARGDQDFIAVYTDTLVHGPGDIFDWVTFETHHPLSIKVTQTSSVWANPMIDDFVLLEYKVANIGPQPLHDLYVGLFLEPTHVRTTTYNYREDKGGWSDEIGGYLETYPASRSCGFADTLGLAWATSAFGTEYTRLPDGYSWVLNGPSQSILSAVGVRLLDAPKQAETHSVNWWAPAVPAATDYGPRHHQPGGVRRDFGNGSGAPYGDANRYDVLSNGELDLDVPRVLLMKPDDPVWEYGDVNGGAIQTGFGLNPINTLYSVGPFDLVQGEEQAVVFAIAGGENFHIDPGNYYRLIHYDVDDWYAHVDFSNLALNSRIAGWVYDNPGYDTDGDGYRGKSFVCVLDSVYADGQWTPSVAETTFYAGDGIPDWRAVGPPPAPTVWLYPFDGGIRIRFNGKDSETTRDLVSSRIDFEGYHVYLGRDDREASLALVAGLDRQDYDKLVWNPKLDYPNGDFAVQQIPFSLQELRCLYGRTSEPCADSSFDPLAYSRTRPYRLAGFEADSVFYFVAHGFNASRAGIDSPIRKIYPNAAKPVPGLPLPDSAYTPDGYVKYYEYELTLDSLLPSVPYYLNVTAFDYGDPSAGVEALESSKLLGLQSAFPLDNQNQHNRNDKPVYIYPNPYRVDEHHRTNGYEGRGSDRINDRERRIYFANLPARCVIRIHTLDGDLVREIRHEYAAEDPRSDHDSWDLINRNIMAVESGLYYWSVEDEQGKVQLGKLVIIK